MFQLRSIRNMQKFNPHNDTQMIEQLTNNQKKHLIQCLLKINQISFFMEQIHVTNVYWKFFE